MKRLLPPIFSLFAALITPLHGSVTLDLGGGQTSGATITTASAGTLQLSPSNLQINAGSTLRLDTSYLSAPNNGVSVYSSLNGGTLSLGTATGYLSGVNTYSGLITAGTGGTIQLRPSNIYNYTSPTLGLYSGVIGATPLVSSTPLLLQQSVGPSLYPSLTQAGPLLLPLNAGVLVSPVVTGGTLSFGIPSISLGSSALTTLSSNIQLIASGGTLVTNTSSSFPNIYGATVVNGSSQTTIASATVLTAGSLIRTGAGTLTLTSATLAAGNTLNVISGSSLGTGIILSPNTTLIADGTPIPEPGSVLLLAGGLGTLFLRRRRTPRG